ncbi:4-hydroxybenzoate 3-monooxygenase [Synechococcus sp. PCC 7336]|uniref:4-hydroxybenzoate 3-monooxygenase n=1 Tax=Synechococcus sp. PCC 7336 TaxID=195250 RepID=UPI0003469BFF|nr:4-hydroxybenzoate 3-monooxygenase [Synechococcus sp. PCC 7336]
MAEDNKLKTSVCILGAGPAGILLGNILLENGVDCIVLDRYDRDEIFQRGRAGLIESTTVELLKKHGLAETVLANAELHDSCEFRYPNKSILFNYADLNGGEVHYVYPQSNLNDDLIQKYLDAGGKLLFRHEGTQILQSDNGVAVECLDRNTGTIQTIQADFVAGCDGYHGISRRSIPASAVKIYSKQYNYRWLAILAYAPPSVKCITYALHPEGFAGHMLRNSEISRYYLQIPLADELEDWPDERIWATLRRRLAQPGWELIEGEIFQKNTMDLRNYVLEPMRYRRLLVAGDAAHIITPMGGKGLNLAIQDAGMLGETLVHYYLEQHDLSYLDLYSELRLPYIWAAQEFSCSLLHMVHLPEGDDLEDINFLRKLSESKLSQLNSSTTFARNFARNYVGIRLQQEIS